MIYYDKKLHSKCIIGVTQNNNKNDNIHKSEAIKKTGL